MHTTRLPSIFSQIQEDVRTAIKPVIKKTTAGSGSTDIININCNLFLLSEVEIVSSFGHSSEEEGTQYAYWAQHDIADDRRKGPQSNPTDYKMWWERSPDLYNSRYFCYILSYGTSYPGIANGGCYVSFAFCI